MRQMTAFCRSVVGCSDTKFAEGATVERERWLRGQVLFLLQELSLRRAIGGSIRYGIRLGLSAVYLRKGLCRWRNRQAQKGAGLGKKEGTPDGWLAASDGGVQAGLSWSALSRMDEANWCACYA